MTSTMDRAYRGVRKTYSVFTRFRRSRLALGRGMPTVEVAIAFANRVRQVRFHDPDHVFVVDDETGAVVDEPERSDGVHAVESTHAEPAAEVVRPS